jgi:C4-dicarboxylate-specific signal transduction histidine kinase
MKQIKPRGSPGSPRRPGVADRLELQEQVTELAAQQAAMSEVLHSIANSPHELEPIFDTITANATRLCRAEVGALILFEEHGYRVVARTGVADTHYVKGHLYPVSEGAPSARMVKTRSPVHIADLAADQAYLQRIPGLVALVEQIGVRSYLLVPMLKDDELVGGITIVRARMQPFTDKQIELVTAFAAQATIALEITRRERQLRQVQMELAHATRVAAMGHLTSSLAHELKQPLCAVAANADASSRWLMREPPQIENAKQSVECIIKDVDRACAVIDRVHSLVKKTAPRRDTININDAILEVMTVVRGEVVRNRIRVQTQLSDSLPRVRGDRVQLQQVMLNLIINAVQAMSGITDGIRELRISTGSTKEEVRVAVRDTGPGLSASNFQLPFEPFYTTKPSGMGMGLSICRAIVEEHGGRLWAGANEPQGALFQFALPPTDGADRDQTDASLDTQRN